MAEFDQISTSVDANAWVLRTVLVSNERLYHVRLPDTSLNGLGIRLEMASWLDEGTGCAIAFARLYRVRHVLMRWFSTLTESCCLIRWSILLRSA